MVSVKEVNVYKAISDEYGSIDSECVEQELKLDDRTVEDFGPFLKTGIVEKFDEFCLTLDVELKHNEFRLALDVNEQFSVRFVFADEDRAVVISFECKHFFIESP